MSVAADRQRRLLAVLACPACNDPVQLRDATTVDDAVVDAEIDCGRCGQVGVIRSYRPSFLPADIDGWSPPGLAERPVPPSSIGEASGQWDDISVGKLGSPIGACLTGTTDASAIAVRVGTNRWGATAVVTLGATSRDVPLYSSDPSMGRVVVFDNQSSGTARSWSVLIAPPEPATLATHQGIIESICELVAADQAPPLGHHPVNRGNPYPDRFAAILADTPEDAVIFDLGGGDRCHSDPRVLNFEYMKFAAPDLFGDGLHLPLADGSVDVILSQAVLEHVPDPQRAVDEMRRVLRPDGKLYAEFAFMQPLHAVPYHFFNITPHGAALLFDRWAVQDTGTFGGLTTTLRWIFDLVDAKGKVGANADLVLEVLAELDRQLSPESLEYAASAVFVEATPGHTGG